jgi:hypothetical protein
MVGTNSCGRLFSSYARKNKAQVAPTPWPRRASDQLLSCHTKEKTMAGKTWLDEIPSKLIKLPVVHTPEVLLQLKKPILGAVLHTTNPKGNRLLTLQESRNDFAGSGPPQEPLFRSAHFMVDRSGLIAQFRSLDQGSAHIGPPWMPNYVGIEHTAFHKDPLVDPEQINASADLLNMLKSELGLRFQSSPKQALPALVGTTSSIPPNAGRAHSLTREISDPISRKFSNARFNAVPLGNGKSM